jgi:hypothetical protein
MQPVVFFVNFVSFVVKSDFMLCNRWCGHEKAR